LRTTCVALPSSSLGLGTALPHFWFEMHHPARNHPVLCWPAIATLPLPKHSRFSWRAQENPIAHQTKER